MQIMEVPENGSMFAIDFEGVERLVPAGVAGGFEGGERAIFEAREKGAGIINADLLDSAAEGVLALFDEGFGHGIDFIYAAVEPDGRINAMSQEVASNAAAGDFDV